MFYFAARKGSIEQQNSLAALPEICQWGSLSISKDNNGLTVFLLVKKDRELVCVHEHLYLCNRPITQKSYSDSV